MSSAAGDPPNDEGSEPRGRDRSTELDPGIDDVEAPAAGEGRLYLIARGAEGARVIELDEGGDVTVGRAEDATISVNDSRVSRLHARFKRDERGALLVDLGSRNGTKVNGRTVRGAERRLRGGDVVRAGPIEIFVAAVTDIDTGAAAAPEAPRPPTSGEELDELLGQGVIVADAAMVRVYQIVRRLARAPTTALVLGETGAGKEVIVEQLHRWSPRATGPFVRLNCASLPETLLESVLFGHEKGSFTGADRKKEGFLEAASGGTLFLDEIGELPLAMQAKLLRVLENRTIQRVGGTQEIAVDVRLVCATHKDLTAEVAAGRFRQDLFYRVGVFTLKVPPLRERPGEIVLLAELFARRFATEMGLGEAVLDVRAAERLLAHDWPGNVRELRNVMEHAVVMANGAAIGPEHLPETFGGPGVDEDDHGKMRERLGAMERLSIERALEAEGQNQTRAAKRLGMSRRALLYKLAKYGIKRD